MGSIMVKLQEVKGRHSITVPKVIVDAMSLKKGDDLKFKFNGTHWEIRKD